MLIRSSPILDRSRNDAHTRIKSISNSDFARALIGILVPDEAGNTTVDEVKQAIVALDENDPIRKPLLALVSEAGANLVDLRESIEGWFDSAMTSLSDIYKRNTKWVMFGLGLVVAFSFNVDAIHAAEELYRDDALRQSISQQVDGIVADCEKAETDAKTAGEEFDVSGCASDAVDALGESLVLPVGWVPGSGGFDAWRVVGWVIAAAAIAQGAPFWFDLLRKATGLRK